MLLVHLAFGSDEVDQSTGFVTSFAKSTAHHILEQRMLERRSEGAKIDAPAFVTFAGMLTFGRGAMALQPRATMTGRVEELLVDALLDRVIDLLEVRAR